MTSYQFGRNDVGYATAPTMVSLAVSGLAAWSDGDSLQIVSPNAGMTFSNVESGFAAGPAIGGSTIRNETLDWRGALAPVVDAARGDTTWVTQLAARTTGGVHYRTLATAGIASGFTVNHGGNATLRADLAPAPTRSITLAWQGSRFAALAADVSPLARPAGTPALAIHALPDVLAQHNGFFRRFYTQLPTLVELGPISSTADFTAAFDLGDPFGWTDFLTVTYPMAVGIPTPDGVATLNALFVAAEPLDAASHGIAPAISPVRNVVVDGNAVRWDPPALGTATSYSIAVEAIEGSPTGVRVTTLATFFTDATAVHLPASVLAPARSYVLRITAIAAPGTDLARRPYVGALPFASADHITDLLTNGKD